MDPCVPDRSKFTLSPRDTNKHFVDERAGLERRLLYDVCEPRVCQED